MSDVRKVEEKTSPGFKDNLKRRFMAQIERVSAEAEERARRNEIALFASPLIRFAYFLLSLVVFISILRFTAPPRLLTETIATAKAMPVPTAELCFGSDCLADSKRIHFVSLPDFAFGRFSDANDRNLFYRMTFDLSPLPKEFDAVFMPIVWGDSETFVNGTLIAAGPNVRPIVALKPGSKAVVTIHVKSPSGSRLGMRSTYPPYLTTRVEAKALQDQLAAEPFAFRYSFVAQLAALCLLFVMYLAFPYRPELFAFLALFGIETTRTALFFVINDGRVLVSPAIDRMFYNALVVAGVIAVTFFVATFFRRPISYVRIFLRDNAVWLIGSAITGYILFTSSISALDGTNALFIVLWTEGLIAALTLAFGPLIYLSSNKKLRVRFCLGITTLVGVGYWAFANIRDHFVLTHGITTEYNNHLHFFFFMAAILGIEIGRTEVKIKDAYSLLSKEVVGLLSRGENTWREGFVVLVDIVGWTSKLKRLKEEQTPQFIERLNRYLLEPFDDFATSVLNGTGDGFYLTFEGVPSRERFEKLVSACKALAMSRTKCGELGIDFGVIKDEPIIVRSAIGYGKYFVGMSQTRYLKHDFLAGYLGPFLARVIGNDKDPKGPRILLGSALDEFKAEREVFLESQKTEETRYWIAD